jgi:NAD(P)-dependent dehydrogenase (short-subunit alcohol dehydrogenase family)
MTDYNPFSLQGKTILVTGASSGIGQETAIQCSRLGAKIIITGRNEERLKETFMQLVGEGHKLDVADLTNVDDNNMLVDNLHSINGLVLCAGKGLTSPFSFSTRDKYDEIFDVNFFAPIELLRLLVKKKKLEKNSSVVFVSSIAGIASFSFGNGVYGASKAALDSTMRFCARELGAKKIRVNTVNPGMVNTRFIKGGAISEDQYKIDMESYPLKRYGEPVDIAYGIIYLLSDASSWVTGHSLIIDGGKTLY